MGFTSAGRGLGSTFFFELPLYSSSSASLHEDHLDMTPSVPSIKAPSEANIEQPMSPSSRRRQSLDGRIPVIKSVPKHFDFDQICPLKEAVDKDNLDIKDDESSDSSKEADSAQFSPSKRFNNLSHRLNLRLNLLVETETSLQSAESELDVVMITPIKAKIPFFDEGDL